MPLKGGWIWLIGKVLVIGCEKTGGNGLTPHIYCLGPAVKLWESMNRNRVACLPGNVHKFDSSESKARLSNR